jgi:K+-transporting ATPase KdpF subunit
MTALAWLGLVLAIGSAAYLAFALLFPERLS